MRAVHQKQLVRKFWGPDGESEKTDGEPGNTWNVDAGERRCSFVDRSNINARYVNARPSSLKAFLSFSFLFLFFFCISILCRKEIGSFEFWHWNRKRYTPPYNTFCLPHEGTVLVSVLSNTACSCDMVYTYGCSCYTSFTRT